MSQNKSHNLKRPNNPNNPINHNKPNQRNKTILPLGKGKGWGGRDAPFRRAQIEGNQHSRSAVLSANELIPTLPFGGSKCKRTHPNTPVRGF
jgi:hypothetical protein